jgi:thiol-disulfide isomerase/thioredoxin
MTLKIGAHTPPISLSDTKGRRIAVPDEGRLMIAFVSPDCPTCLAIAPALEILATSAERWHYTFYVIAGGKKADFAAFAARTKTRINFLLEPAPFALRAAYGVTQTPTLFLLNDRKVESVQEGWSRDEWQKAVQAVFTREMPDLSTLDGIPAFKVGTALKKG